MVVGVLIVSALLAAHNAPGSNNGDGCGATLIQAGTELLVCAKGNDYLTYLPQVINKTMTPEDLVNKFCDEMSVANCLRNFVNQTKDCFDDQHKQGLGIAIKVADVLTSRSCDTEGRQHCINELTQEPYCTATVALAEEACGRIDIVGFVHPFDRLGCKIMKDQLNCLSKIQEASKLCSDDRVSYSREGLELMYQTTPCGVFDD